MKRFTLMQVWQYVAITLLAVVFSWLASQRIKESLSYQPYPIGYDARSYITAATALRQGYSPYEDATWRLLSIDYQVAKYLYPPLLAILLIPVSYLPIFPATYICMLFSFLSAIVLSLLLRRSLDWKMALITVFAFPPTWVTIYYGQINFLVAILLLLSFHALASDRKTQAGIYLFIGALLKITPIMSTILLLLRGYRRSIFWGITTVAAIILLTLPIANLQTWIVGGYFAVVQNWFVPGLASWTGMLTYLSPSFSTGIALSWIISGVLIVLTMLRVKNIPLELGLSATILLPLLIARITWGHHAVIAIPAFIILWKRSPGNRILAVLSWIIIIIFDYKAMPWVLTLCWIASCWPECIDYLEYLTRSKISAYLQNARAVSIDIRQDQ